MRNRFLLCHVCAAKVHPTGRTIRKPQFSSQNGFFCPQANAVNRRAVVPAGVHTLMCSLLQNRSTDPGIYRSF